MPDTTRRTDSTNAIIKTISDMLLSWANAEGKRASQVIEDRMYQVRAPNNVTFPYATVRLATRNDGKYHGMRLDGMLEVQVYGRPWSQQKDVNDVADLFDQAMVSTVENGHGLIFCHGWQRDALPPGGSPVDSETVTIRLVYTLAIWPEYLTSLSRTI